MDNLMTILLPLIEFVSVMKLDDAESCGALEPRGVSAFMSPDPAYNSEFANVIPVLLLTRNQS